MVSVSQPTITMLARFSLFNSNLGTPAIQIAFEYLSEIKVILFSNRQDGSYWQVGGWCQIPLLTGWRCIWGKSWLINWQIQTRPGSGFSSLEPK